MRIYLDEEQAEYIKLLIEENTKKMASMGADMEHLSMLVDAWNKIVTEQKQLESHNEVKANAAAKKEVKKGRPKKDHLLDQCYDCSEYMKGCRGALEEKCMFNKEFSSGK